MAYSVVSDVASSKASLASSTCARTVSTFFDMVAITPIKRWPSEPRSFQMLPSAFMLPLSRIFSMICRMASIALPCEKRLLIVPFSMFSCCSIRLWLVCKDVKSLPKAVAATSGACPKASAALPNAKSSGVVIPVIRDKPVRRFEKSTICVPLAVEVAASWLMAEPTDSMDFSTPSFGMRPIVSMSFEICKRLSSPRSSERATLTWSAARTNSTMPSTPYFPNPILPPWYAKSDNSWMLVRVSSFAMLSASSFTSLVASPVTLRMSANWSE